MLTDAGVPVGFKMTMNVNSASLTQQDIAAVLKDQWARFGVEVEIVAYESASFSRLLRSQEYADTAVRRIGAIIPRGQFYLTAIWPKNHSVYYNEYIDEQYVKAQSTKDIDERTAIYKDLGVYFLEEVAWLYFGNFSRLVGYWPWVRNYYGELDAGIRHFTPIIARLWLDQDLKEDMGY